MREPLAGIPGDVCFLDLQLLASDGTILSTNRYIFSRTANLAPLLACPPTRLSASSFGEDLMVTNCGETTAMFVWLEDSRDLSLSGYAYFDDNYFCLLPGESRTVKVTWMGVPAGEQCLEVSGWNTERLLLQHGEA